MSDLTRRKPYRHHVEHHLRSLHMLSQVPRGARVTGPYKTWALQRQSVGAHRKTDAQRRKKVAC